MLEERSIFLFFFFFWYNYLRVLVNIIFLLVSQQHNWLCILLFLRVYIFGVMSSKCKVYYSLVDMFLL